MKPVQILLHAFLFIALTVLTQIGGAIYLLNLLLFSFIDVTRFSNFSGRVLKAGSFFLLYFGLSFTLIPVAAKQFGRVPLPVSSSGKFRPLNSLTCFLNRHYVRPEMKYSAVSVSESIAREFPGAKLNYLDANFPFFNGFPLIPHLSHNDGKKLDLAFAYNKYDLKTGAPSNEAPSFIGYGICEEPVGNEPNTPQECAQKGAWQYSFLKRVVPQGNSKNYTLNEKRTARIVELFATESAIGKIFIEPHLKQRLNLRSDKIRFHGCRAVRHDDHLHVQLK